MHYGVTLLLERGTTETKNNESIIEIKNGPDYGPFFVLNFTHCNNNHHVIAIVGIGFSRLLKSLYRIDFVFSRIQ